MKEEFQKAIRVIEQAKSILVVTTERASIDEISALLALKYLFKKTKQKATCVYHPTKLPENLVFLPGEEGLQANIGKENELVISLSTAENKVADLSHVMHDNSLEIIVRGEKGMFSADDVSFKKSAEKFDVILTIGGQNLESFGPVFLENAQTFSETPIVNLSADINNDYFGKINLIDAKYTAVCEIVLHLLETNEKFAKNIDKSLSTILMTGILSETDNFLAETTPSALEAAAKLQTLGAEHSQIVEHLFKEKTQKNLSTLGQILNNLELSTSHQFAWAVLTQKDFDQTETKEEDIDHWTDQLLRHINGSDFFALIVEEKGQVYLQIRNRQSKIDFSNTFDEFDVVENSAEKVKNGINIRLSGKFDAVKTQILGTLAVLQQERLHLEEDQKMEIYDLEAEIEAEKEAAQELEMTIEKKQPKTSPKAPLSIPFEIPKKDEE